MSNSELSIIVLCYKSGTELIPYIDSLIQKVSTLDIPFDLVLVCNYDKGEKENNSTYKIASELKNTRPVDIDIIFEEKEGGMGWDLKTGIQAAQGKYICFLDGDGQTNPSDICILYQVIKDKDVSLAKTYRKTRYDGRFRTLQSIIYNILFNLIYTNGRQRLKDINSKPKMALRETFISLDLQSNDWYIDAEIIIKLLKSHQKIVEIPTVFYANTHRKSFVQWNTIFEFLKNMFLKKI